mmetsp:Transcript_14824/g.51988  ORF Transcript_14824/g.51988 Transcript_14824/m.51988 type:complete len:207 (+) Transcript_14824:224-844(+)
MKHSVRSGPSPTASWPELQQPQPARCRTRRHRQAVRRWLREACLLAPPCQATSQVQLRRRHQQRRQRPQQRQRRRPAGPPASERRRRQRGRQRRCQRARRPTPQAPAGSRLARGPTRQAAAATAAPPGIGAVLRPELEARVQWPLLCLALQKRLLPRCLPLGPQPRPTQEPPHWALPGRAQQRLPAPWHPPASSPPQSPPRSGPSG